MGRPKQYWLGRLALAVAAISLAACSQSIDEVSEFAPSTSPTTTTTTTSPTTTTLAPLPDPINADPITNQFHDRADEVYLYYSDVKESGFIDHIDCVTEAAKTAVGEERLREDGLLDTKARLEIEQLTSREIDDLALALAECRTRRVLLDLIAIDLPRQAICIAEETNDDPLTSMIIATGRGETPAEQSEILNLIEPCDEQNLERLRLSITPTLVDERIGVGEEMVSLLDNRISFTEYERECAVLTVADRINSTFVERYVNSGAADIVTYIRATQDDLHTRDSARYITDAWSECVLLGSILNELADLGLDDVDLNCVNQEYPRDFNTAFALSSFLDGFTTERDARSSVATIISRCGDTEPD